MIRKNFKNANNVSSIIKHKTTEQYIKDYNKQEKKQIKQEKNKLRKEKFVKGASYLGSHGGNLLSVLIILLVGVALIRVLYNGSADTVSFRSLLDLLSNAPQVSTSVKNFVQQLQFTEPWVILDAFRIFLNSIVQIVSIGVWMASSLIDVILFLSYFLSWLFI